jgi:hypothetical protein
MAAARRKRYRRLAGAARGSARGRRCPGGRRPGRARLARTGECGPRPSQHRAGGRHELGGRHGGRRSHERAHPDGRRRHADLFGHFGSGGATLVRRDSSNHNSAQRGLSPRGSHAAQLFGTRGGRWWWRRQHAGTAAARPHAGGPARPDDRPGARDRRVAAGARRARDGRSSRQGAGLPTQAVAGSTAGRYSFHTSTETSSTGSGIGGSGLAALTRTLSAP